MSVLDRDALDASPLADLHAIASELSIDGYRRLRRAELIDAILDRQAGKPAAEPPEAEGEDEAEAGAGAEEAEPDAEPRRRRGRRGGRGRARGAGDEPDTTSADDEPDEPAAEKPERPDAATAKPERPDSGAAKAERPDSGTAKAEPQVVEGVVELAPNGSAFVRLAPPDPSDDDVYISAAQVKRCELVDGDRISGPLRPARRSERFPSLVRIETINGRPAEEVADGVHFDELAAAFPQEQLVLGSEHPTLAAIDALAPIGKGSRVAIVGPSRAGKTEALRALASALSAREGLELFVVLAGVRPEEIHEWSQGPVQPVAATSFASSADAQAHAVERALDQARRIAPRGADAVVLIDTLEGLHPPAARKALASARNLLEGGSLTVIATAARTFGGETTVVALDGARASAGQFPAIDPLASGTIRPELLVGEAGAEAIARARAEAAPGPPPPV